MELVLTGRCQEFLETLASVKEGKGIRRPPARSFVVGIEHSLISCYITFEQKKSRRDDCQPRKSCQSQLDSSLAMRHQGAVIMRTSRHRKPHLSIYFSPSRDGVGEEAPSSLNSSIFLLLLVKKAAQEMV